MRFVKIENGIPTKEMSVRQVDSVIKEHFNISARSISDMPNNVLDEWIIRLIEIGIELLELAPTPDFNPDTHKLGDFEIVKIDGVWKKQLTVVQLSDLELEEIDARKQMEFEKDMNNTVGLMLVKLQTGKATQQDVEDAVAAVEVLHGRTL